ncbi:CapA family protein [Sinorhizobium sp. CB9]
MRFFLCGDVMVGRGIDQILPNPSNPLLHEPFMRSAEDYVELAEQKSGPIVRGVSFDYIWGDALAEIDRRSPDLRIINLETSITTSEAFERKGINYRMHPKNIGCISAARIDCCVLANNHIADWGMGGAVDTVETLEGEGIATAGFGPDSGTARSAAVLTTKAGRRVLVFAFACSSSGVPSEWAAEANRRGVNFLAHLDEASFPSVVDHIAKSRRPDDIVVASIHWGGNWGYKIPTEHWRFAHALIDMAGVDIVHGHSSHHAMPIEVHAGRPILYGCGDFINDYEGIKGYEIFRPELVLGYFLDLHEHTHVLQRLEMVPFRMRSFSLHRASQEEAVWLRSRLDPGCRRMGGRIDALPDGVLCFSSCDESA